jgi:hypothetical protein
VRIGGSRTGYLAGTGSAGSAGRSGARSGASGTSIGSRLGSGSRIGSTRIGLAGPGKTRTGTRAAEMHSLEHGMKRLVIIVGPIALDPARCRVRGAA